MLNTCFSSGSLEFWYMPGTGCQCNHPTIKTLGTECLIAFLVDISLYCYNSMLEVVSISCVIPLGENPWKLVPGFLQTLFHVPFTFADFALYHFAVINYNCEYNYTQSPYGSSQQITQPRGFLENPRRNTKSKFTGVVKRYLCQKKIIYKNNLFIYIHSLIINLYLKNL